LFITCLQHMM